MNILIDKIIHLREVKCNNEKRVPMRELREGRYKAAYSRLCVELGETQEQLRQECISHIKGRYPGTGAEVQCAAEIFVQFCGLKQDDDAGWEEFVDTTTKIGNVHQSETLNRMLRHIALELDEWSARRA